MNILGVNGGIHDTSAALLRDGQLVALVENERLTRKKRAVMQSPATAIDHCLSRAGLALDDIDVIAVGWEYPNNPTRVGERYSAKEMLVYYEWMLNPEIPYQAIFGADRWTDQSGTLPSRRPPIRYVSHHVAHAAASMWTSGHDWAAVLIADGRGELHSTSIGTGTFSSVDLTRTWDITQSLGNFYGFASEWAGLDFWDAGKLMGLAAYGDPQFSIPLSPTDDGYQLTCLTDEPWDRVDWHAEQQRTALRRSFEQCCFPFEDGDGTEIMAYADFAASVQQALEAVMLNLARVAVEEAGSDNLVIGGGVGMNCSMIGALARSGAFADVYVPPFTYDAGVSLGAALMVAREQSGWAPLPRLDHAYLGYAPKDGDVEDELSGSGLVVRRLGPGEVATTTAQLLSEGAVVGWFQGRAEVGQRALGARSIVGDPRHRRHLAQINRLKGREMWRPLAPSVLAEYAGDLFTGGIPHATRFMLAAYPVRPDVHPLIPATVHVDGTARPQLVSRDTNPEYWSMIDGFRQRTGVPAVVNTSFNLAGEPIVYSPRDAVSAFIRSSLDALAIGDYLVTRSESDGTGA